MHLHILTWSYISPKLLEIVSEYPELRDLAMQTIDSTAVAQVSLKTLEIVNQHKRTGEKLTPSVFQVIPQIINILKSNKGKNLEDYDGKLESEYVFTAEASATVVNHHVHSHRCKKGKDGEKKCAMGYAQCTNNKTEIVELHEVQVDAVFEDDDAAILNVDNKDKEGEKFEKILKAPLITESELSISTTNELRCQIKIKDNALQIIQNLEKDINNLEQTDQIKKLQSERNTLQQELNCHMEKENNPFPMVGKILYLKVKRQKLSDIENIDHLSLEEMKLFREQIDIELVEGYEGHCDIETELEEGEILDNKVTKEIRKFKLRLSEAGVSNDYNKYMTAFNIPLMIAIRCNQAV